ncbi:MAG: methionyl-tRNA formyltransferase [Alphaproteobacteria bacterium]|nr:methionyl-tRNA formyltransferase [Alphaproteobacteria bacterium]
MPLKIVFMGTPDFAVPALQGLIDSAHKVVAVYTQPPRPAGRGQKLRPSPIHKLAESHNIPVQTPVNFKQITEVCALQDYVADIAVVAAYGLLLPKNVLKSFPYGCINIHPSALPRWRGAAPIHRTVMAGDTTTDICIMQMDEGLDTGAVLQRVTQPVADNITTGILHDKLAQDAAPILLDTLQQIETGQAQATPQPETGVTYAKKITKAESHIDWNLPNQAILQLINGLNPFPAAVTSLNGEPLKILSATLDNSPHSHKPGAVSGEDFTIACGKGMLRPTIVQRAGKKPMPVCEMLKGCPIAINTVLGN